jgi:hypothetical protein
MTNQDANVRPPRRGAKSGVFTLILLGLSIVAVTFIPMTGASSLNGVDITIHTTQNLPFQYALTAYNTSGYQVANFYGNFPEAAFWLPSGTYLITASAYQQYNYCYYCAVPAMATAGAVGGAGAPPAAGGAGVAMPVRYPPYSEYGYAVIKVTGNTQITIATSNNSQTSLTNYQVHVGFVNGTAAEGAYVSAYVVGSYYSYSQGWTSYGQADRNGDVTLAMPAAPIQVNAYLSVPIHLPKGISTVTVEVGGQKVNVTVYWQPNYVSLVGQALILPPDKSAKITLHVQQQAYPSPINYGGVVGPAQTGAPGVTTVTTTKAAGQELATPPQGSNIAPFSPTSAQLSSPGQQATEPPSGLATPWTVVVGVGAAALIGAGVAFTLSRRKQVPQSTRP